MWENIKQRDLAFWQLHVSSDMDRSISAYLKSPGGSRFRSRSNLVQEAVRRKLERDAPILADNLGHDPLRLSHDLANRRAEERSIARRHVRWCVVLDRAIDRKLRAFLTKYGARHGAHCRFVDDALRELIG